MIDVFMFADVANDIKEGGTRLVLFIAAVILIFTPILQMSENKNRLKTYVFLSVFIILDLINVSIDSEVIKTVLLLINSFIFCFVFYNLLVILKSRKEKRVEKNIKNKNEKESEAKDKEESLVLAIDELNSGNIDKLTWAKAFIEADGDEIKAKVIYVKIRKK